MGQPEFALSFIPNVAPWFSGIVSVLNAPLKQSMRASDIIGLYEEKYANEPLCKVVKGVPDVRDAAGKHGWRVGGVQVHSSGNRVVVVVSNWKRKTSNHGYPVVEV
jgi:N-acetyl-gamma-glutamyl-phosphate reductase/acetylglutamate kinase